MSRSPKTPKSPFLPRIPMVKKGGSPIALPYIVIVSEMR